MSSHPWEPRCTPPRGLVIPVPVDPTGVAGPTKRQATQRRWRPTGPRRYVPSETDSTVVEQRILEASAALPPIGAVTGWAACRMYGAAFHDGLARDGRTALPVPLALGNRGWMKLPPGTVGDYTMPTPRDWRTIAGVRVLDPVRATFDAMRAAPDLRESVVELEKSLMGEIASRQEVAAYAAGRKGAHGIQRIRDALPLARENARSPQETRTRLIAHLDAGVDTWLVNPDVYDEQGNFVGETDLLDPESGLVLEYNGADHEQEPRRHRDAVKMARLVDIGLEVLFVTPQQLGPTGGLAERVLRARSRAFQIPGQRRRWHAVPKPEDLDSRLRAAREYAAYMQAMEGT